MSESPAYVYLLKCSDSSLYCGWTFDIPDRLSMHRSGKGSKYVRSRLPVSLVYCESRHSKSDALRREAAIKHLSRKEKIMLLDSVDNLVGTVFDKDGVRL